MLACAPGVTLSSADVSRDDTVRRALRAEHRLEETTAPLTAGDLEAGWG